MDTHLFHSFSNCEKTWVSQKKVCVPKSVGVHKLGGKKKRSVSFQNTDRFEENTVLVVCLDGADFDFRAVVQARQVEWRGIDKWCVVNH